jgi:hypothetical protein
MPLYVLLRQQESLAEAIARNRRRSSIEDKIQLQMRHRDDEVESRIPVETKAANGGMFSPLR